MDLVGLQVMNHSEPLFPCDEMSSEGTETYLGVDDWSPLNLSSDLVTDTDDLTGIEGMDQTIGSHDGSERQVDSTRENGVCLGPRELIDHIKRENLLGDLVKHSSPPPQSDIPLQHEEGGGNA